MACAVRQRRLTRVLPEFVPDGALSNAHVGPEYYNDLMLGDYRVIAPGIIELLSV
jgi:hypothetical protein